MIIGLGYVAKSGKDTVADLLRRKADYHRIGFADKLKSVVRVSHGLTEAQLFGDQKEVLDPRWGMTPREVLQRTGVMYREQFGADFWVRSLKAEIDMTTANLRVVDRAPFDWVIPDVRFRNEADAIHAWGGIVVRVDRPGAGATGGVAGHVSEVELDGYAGWDYVVANSGTLDDLANQAEGLVRFARYREAA